MPANSKEYNLAYYYRTVSKNGSVCPTSPSPFLKQRLFGSSG